MKSLDTSQFSEAVIKKMNWNINNKHWQLAPIIQVKKVHDILPSLWYMIRKRDIHTGKFYKHNSILNVHRGGNITPLIPLGVLSP